MLNDHRQKISTPAEKLRGVLDQLETLTGKMEYSTREELLGLLPLFDEATTIFAELRQSNVPVLGEQARFETVSEKLKLKGNLFLRKIGGVDALEQARQAHAPGDAQWWWFIDAWLLEQKQSRTRHTLRYVGIAATVLAVLAVLYMLFFAPDEATRARFKHQFMAERLLQEQDYAAALDEVKTAIGFTPDVAELYVLQGVLEELLEQPIEAQASFDSARALLDGEESFLLLRAQKYLEAMLPEKALVDADAIVASNPDSAEGHYFKGRAHHALGDFMEADASYQMAAELASAADQAELEATARVQMAYLLQEMMAASDRDMTETPDTSPGDSN